QDPQDDGSDTYQLWSLLQVFTELTGHATPYALAELHAQGDQAPAQVLSWSQHHQIVFTETDTTTTLQRWVQTYRATTQGHSRYQARAQLTCPIHLFRVSEKTYEPDATAAFSDDRPHWGWNMHTQAQVHEIHVPGTHVTMMARPQVCTLAASIRACLPHSLMIS
ncbi:MAG: hypothetical protein AAF669_08545, partial [Pseudomonadota bacterium]